MLNKRIKSLLVAGIVILGMGFAKVDSFAAETLTSAISNIDFVEGETQKVVTLQQGYITVTIKNNDGVYDVVVEWDKTMVNVIGIDSLFENGDSLFSDFNTCYDVVYNENKVIVTIKDVNVVPEGFNSVGELVGVNVHFTLVDSDGDGVPDFKDDTPNPGPGGEEPDPEDPVEPEEPVNPDIDDPETGDASIMPIVVTALASAAGLFVLSKKDDEE